MTSKCPDASYTRRKAEEHFKMLEKLDTLTLSDSCCEICHCDCYSSHRSSDSDVRICVDELERIDAALLELDLADSEVKRSRSDSKKRRDSNNNGYNKSPSMSKERTHKSRATRPRTRTKNATAAAVAFGAAPASVSTDASQLSITPSKPTSLSTVTTATVNTTSAAAGAAAAVAAAAAATTAAASKNAKDTLTHSESTVTSTGAIPKTKTLTRKRSKSACSARSRTPSPSPLPLSVTATPGKRISYYTRDCKILQELLNALDEQSSTLEINGKNALQTASDLNISSASQTLSYARRTAATRKNRQTSRSQERATSPLKLCASMASLCLAPTVQSAYQQVPAHDKRILNRMASKRSERVLAKENAWLARKYWENERYERELFKCAQMEEYKRAVRDKQFQDYLLTKARLNEIAQRDLAELQRLREALQEKDASTKRRLNALRVERSIAQCQRRTDELRRAEAVAVQQEEQQLDETLRKEEICARLTDRLQRAEQMRTQMLDGYLRRLRYDNYIEELVHEEHWRETQQLERFKREQLQEQIQQKCEKSQRFVEARQRRNEAIAQTAKISASLRELVRSSVTPECGAATGAGNTATGGSSTGIANTLPLVKVLQEGPAFTKLTPQ